MEAKEKEWISVKDRLPKIKDINIRIDLPLYVKMSNEEITIADYSKSEFRGFVEYVGNHFKPIWICRERGVENSGREIQPTHWMPLPSNS